MAVYVLTEEDVVELREVLAERRRRSLSTANRPRVDAEYDGLPPEVYIAYTPTGGIPALAVNITGTGTQEEDDTPGSAECDIYRIIDGFFVSTGVTRTVYNLSPLAVDGKHWIVVMRDKWGTWVIPNIGKDFGVCP